MDHVVYKNIFSRNRANLTDYLLRFDHLGDGLEISNIASGATVADGFDVPTRVLSLGQCRGGKVSRIINGIVTCNNTGPGVEISLGHWETGGVILDSASCVVTKNLFFMESGNVAVQEQAGVTIKNTSAGGGGTARRNPRIIDNDFMQLSAKREFWQSETKPDINYVGTGGRADIEGNKRIAAISGTLSNQQVMCAQVGVDGVIISDWAAYSHMLERERIPVTPTSLPLNGTSRPVNTFDGWSDGAIQLQDFSANGWTYRGASGPVFYYIEAINDPIRLLGQVPSVTAEASGNVTNGGDIVVLDITLGLNEGNDNRIYRVYRGSATNSFDSVVDIAACGMTRFYDDGLSINGWGWVSRTAGPPETLNVGGKAGRIEMTEGVSSIVIGGAATLPTEGSYRAGDIMALGTVSPPAPGGTVNARVLRVTTGSDHVDGTDWMVEQITRAP